VKTSIKFLEKIMDAPAFRKGGYNTHFIEDNMRYLMAETECASECENLALIAAFVEYTMQLREIEQTMSPASSRHGSDWKEFGRRLAAWRI